MFLKKIQIKNFRNYESLEVDSFNSLNFFFGDNGQGKTSFLEAIYCALRGKSFKPFAGSSFIQEGKEQAFASLFFEEEEGESELEAFFTKKEEKIKKEIKYCGKKVGLSFLDKKFPSFVFTEASLKSIRQGPEERRFFLDDILISRGKRNVVSQFKNILKEKNSLLRSYKKDLISYEEMTKTLEAINVSFLERATELTKERLSLLGDLFLNLKPISQEFFSNQDPELGFLYQISSKKNETPDCDSVFSFLEQDLIEKTPVEIQMGGSLSGPHKHTISFLFNGQDSRTHCSQGQQRSLMLSLLGSQVRQLKSGLLFLDDILMELDEKAQEQTLSFLEKNHCQVFLTNCKKRGKKTKKTSAFFVKNGTIGVHYV